MSTPALTIGMAVFDDFEGVYFTVTSLLIHHAEALRDCQIVVIDNNPGSRQGGLVRSWIGRLGPRVEYHGFADATGTAQARNEVFRRALGHAVLCVDSHVLLAPGVVARLLDYHAVNPETRDLLTGPLLSDGGQIAATHQEPRWSRGAWGVWGVDPRADDPDAPPFPIWQQGMGLFSCRAEAWVGFHPEFRGFGGCESYVMEKVRRGGGQVLCCPWLRWSHRFTRVDGVPYPVSRDDTLRNYLIGFHELGIDPASALDHFRTLAQPRSSRHSALARASGRFAVVGHRSLGAVRMRGETLARHLGCDLIGPDQVGQLARREVIVAVKHGLNGTLVRDRCDLLVYDPLDAFCDLGPAADLDPAEFWRARYRELAFDVIVATSPACASLMREALPDRVRVALCPHHADSQINESWRDDDGPIVYAGLPQFIASGLDRIRQACAMVGKPFVSGRGCGVLKGASLALALRLPPHDSALNRRCKPQVKIANALAAGLAVVATDCPAVTSLYPDMVTVPVDVSAPQLAAAIRRALGQGRRPGPGPGSGQTRHHLGDYLAAMDRILGQRARVVYSAIFGGYDVLHEPLEREPGVHHVCFTDNPRLRSETWEIRYRRPTGNPLLQAKACKILAHEAIDCDVSLWLDGRTTLRSLDGVFDWLQCDLALRRHADRDCIYAEAEHCKRVRRGDPRLIDRSIARYRAEGHPPNAGLWCGGTVLRRHTPAIAAFNGEWWREVTSGTTRDQISLPVALRRLGITFDALPPDLPRIHIGNHAR